VYVEIVDKNNFIFYYMGSFKSFEMVKLNKKAIIISLMKNIV